MAVTNTPDKSEMLLPCPFCGAKLVGTIEQGFGHSSDSPDCILQYGCVDSHDIERWNTRSRPPADQVPDMVERVARAISRATSVDLHGGKLTDYAADDWRDFEGEARAAIAAIPPAGGVEELRETLAKAYTAGATDVHVYWRAGGSDTEPDFAEAARDYADEAVAALNNTSPKGESHE